VFADDRLQEPGAVARFAAGTSSIRIVYAAVSLLNPEAVRFRHRLTGVEDSWHEAARTTSVTYHSLTPGAYRFEVGVTEPSGRWSDRTASTDFTILPAFYQTAWFRALCAALLVGLLWAGYRLRVRRLQRRFEMTLETRVAERTRIARELHDTLLQSVQGLLPHLQTVFLLLPGRAADAKEKLGGVIEQAADAITEGRDVVQGLRESTVQRNDLALAIGLLGEELSRDAPQGGSAKVAMTVHGESRDLHPIVRDEIYKIAAEALRNAFRHARAQRIEVDVGYDDDRFELRVRDDGKGIEPDALREGVEGHFGLHGMHERARVIGATLSIHSEPGAGTEVHLSAPASRAYLRRRRWSWRRVAEPV
jgi:signal transduction histidine kinase